MLFFLAFFLSLRSSTIVAEVTSIPTLLMPQVHEMSPGHSFLPVPPLPPYLPPLPPQLPPIILPPIPPLPTPSPRMSVDPYYTHDRPFLIKGGDESDTDVGGRKRGDRHFIGN